MIYSDDIMLIFHLSTAVIPSALLALPGVKPVQEVPRVVVTLKGSSTVIIPVGQQYV